MNKKFLLLLTSLLTLTSCSTTKDYDVKDYRLTMQFHDNFKILQLTDLHFGIESELEKQMTFVKHSIYEADPDLIILTGDNFMYSSKNVVYYLYNSLNEICKQLTSSHPDRLTKFAVTYGNHDNQGDYYYYYLNDALKNFTTTDGKEVEHNKYAAFIDYKDDNIYGLTNYYIDLVDDRNKSVDEVDVKYRLHIVDSNTYHYVGFKYDYDVIHDDQLAHLNDIYTTASNDKDYIGLAFFHIPFMKYLDAIDQYNNSNEKENIGQGEFLDKEHMPYKDNGSYEKMKQANIIGYFVGHDHKNYGDILYKDENNDTALFSYGVKGTNQLYHDENMIGYKVITLKDNMTKDNFLTIENVKENIVNVINRGDKYE